MENIMKVGFIDRTGKIVIAPMEVDYGYFGKGFSDGLAVFTSPQEKMGAINRSGEVVIQPIYDKLCDFKNGRAIFRDGDVYGLLDASGNVVVEPIYSELTGPDEFGNYKAMRGPSVGFIDRDGNIVIDFNFDKEHIREFVDGYAAAGTDAGWGFIDNTGKWVIEPQYRGAGDFGEGLVPVKVNDTLWQYINIKNEVQFKLELPDASDFCGSFINGIAFIDVDRKKCPINKKGKLINKSKYFTLWSHERRGYEGPIRVSVTFDSQMKFLKPDGKYVKLDGINAREVIKAYDFSEGLAAVDIILPKTAHFYDLNGEIFPTPELRNARSFSEGLAICTTVDSQDIILDREGNIVCTLPKIADRVGYGCFSEGLAWFDFCEDI